MNFLPSTLKPGTENMVYATALADTAPCDDLGPIDAGDTAVCYSGADESGEWHSPLLPEPVAVGDSPWYDLPGVIAVYRTP